MKVVFSLSVFIGYMRTEGQSPIFYYLFKNYGYLWKGPLFPHVTCREVLGLCFSLGHKTAQMTLLLESN